MRFKYVKEDISDDVTYAIKFTSEMTGDSVYVCGKDEEVLDDALYDIIDAFLEVVHSEDDYWWSVAYSKYQDLLDDLDLYEIDDIEEPVDESKLDIISRYSSRY